MAKKQLQALKIKMAMALHGKNIHYQWHTVQRRHFLETAKAADYPVERAEALLDDILQKVDSVIEQMLEKLPKSFPNEVAQPIFDGLRLMKNRLQCLLF
jgi:serine/threonine-protein kinase HipA